MAPQIVSGNGRVATFTINYEPWSPGMTVPFTFAAIELDEQPQLYVFSNVLAPIESVHIGMRVKVDFFDCEGGFALPVICPEAA